MAKKKAKRKALAEKDKVLKDLPVKENKTLKHSSVEDEQKKAKAKTMSKPLERYRRAEEKQKAGKKITAMLLSVAETVGLTQAEITTCKDAGVLIEMIEQAPLYLRAKNKVGMTDEMMASYPHTESLKAACDAIHPQSKKAKKATVAFTAGLNSELYYRARHKAGMSDEMMASYPDAESLKAACDAIHPQSNLDAFPKRGSAPKPVKYKDKMPNKFEIDSKIEAKFISRNRVQFDEANLQAELRRINRKYGAHKPVKIVKTTKFNQVNGKNADRVACKVLVTKYEIYFKV